MNLYMHVHSQTHKKIEIHVLEVNEDRSSEFEEDHSYKDSITDSDAS